MMHGIISVPSVEMIREVILTSAVTMIMVERPVEMCWHTRRNQISSFGETYESIYIGGGISLVEYWQPRCAHQLLFLVVMLDTPCSEVVRRVPATHFIRQFPLRFPIRCVTVCHHISTVVLNRSRLRLKCDGTRVFRRNGRVHLNRRGASVDYWQPRCAHQR